MKDITQQNENIMVVDDTPENLSLLCGILKKKGYSVRPAPNGRLALRAIKADPPDLILLDIQMPELNGYEVCKILKEDEEIKDIPVIFISALMETADKVAAFKAGGVDYITKPFQVEEILARIRTHLQLKRYGGALKKRNDELLKTMERLKETQSQLIQSEKMAALGVLNAGVAHEINNPVNFIKTGVAALQADFNDIITVFEALSAAKENPDDENMLVRYKSLEKEIDVKSTVEEIQDLFKNIFTGIKRCEEIVQSLGILSRQDDRIRTNASIEDIIDSMLLMLKNKFKNKVKIDRVYSGVPKIRCMPGRIGQVVINIVSNAIDAVIQKAERNHPALFDGNGCLGEIKIETLFENKDNGGVLIRISDMGIGILPEHLEKIFDPFFTTKEIGKGTGLGLYLSLEIVKDHGGTIDVKSVPDHGSVFTLRLPASGDMK